jgi:hypothetical protein
LAAVAADAGCQKFGFDAVDSGNAALDAGTVAHHADLVPHGVEELFTQRVQIARPARGWMQRTLQFRIEHIAVRRAVTRIRGDPARHHVAGDAAEHGRVGDAIAAEPVCAMHAACVLACHE